MLVIFAEEEWNKVKYSLEVLRFPGGCWKTMECGRIDTVY
jgi:hypothetical protein